MFAALFCYVAVFVFVRGLVCDFVILLATVVLVFLFWRFGFVFLVYCLFFTRCAVLVLDCG